MSLTYTDIEKAAVQQNWCIERTGREHRKLVPPDKEKPIVVTSGTSSDRRAIKNFLSQMKRSGFTWPWPPIGWQRPGSQEWRNRVNNGEGHLTQNLGDVLLETLTSKAAMPDVVTVQGIEEVDEVTVATTVEVNGSAFEAYEEPREEMDRDGVRWKTLVLPDRFDAPAHGYMVSTSGVCRSPGGVVLKPQLVGKQFYIKLTVDKKRTRTFSVRLDKLVLWAFSGFPTASELETPVHKNHDSSDCALKNLRWRKLSDKPEKVQSRPVKKRRKTVTETEAVTIVKSEPRQHDPVQVADDDEVSVALTFTSHDVTLQFTKGAWSISPCTGLTDDQVTAIGKMIQRWRGVQDTIGG